MATAVQPAMTMGPSFNAHAHMKQCVDPDQEFFDFSQLPSPAPAGLKRESSATSMPSPSSTSIDEDLQTPAKPSHEYERFKQQTGLPSGSIAGLNPGYSSGFPMFSSSGIDEMAMMGDSSMVDSWNTVPADMNMGGAEYQPNYFFSPNDALQDDFVDPSAITQEEVPNVRVWPGMHQQQAAMAKAQAQAQAQAQQQRHQQHHHQQLANQRQAQQHAQQQHNRLQASQSARKSSSPLDEARTEETIARVVAQIRQNGQSAALASQDGSANLLPHIIRAKKDEDDMDEDERLLASEEGKKLSSKERRQLRNKVSARAFRSRRKEYIGQLEGEVAVKVNEANELRAQNRILMEENNRSRAFIERLLRHQALAPFLDELSREACLTSKASMAPMSANVAPVVAAPAPAPAPFPAQQQFRSMSQPENHVSMGLAPETQMDFAMLNINSNPNPNPSANPNWNMSNGFNFQQPQVFAVTDLPEGPANPLDIEAMSGKGYSAIFAAEDDSSFDEVKPDFPVIKTPVQFKQTSMAPVENEDELDDEYDLYRSTPATSAAAPVEKPEVLFTNPEKIFGHFTLVISNEAEETRLSERLQRSMAAMEPVFQRIDAIASMFES